MKTSKANRRPRSDQRLVQIVDAALAENSARCGEWLACRPGCFQCCIGVFEISQLDAVRLRDGLAALERVDPARAASVRRRARESRERLEKHFPGDQRTGTMNDDEEAFSKLGNDEPCPALDPKTGTCDLYAHRPMTCRVFGPPVRTKGGLGICELCFVNAPQEEVERCELVADPHNLEEKVAKEFEKRSGLKGNTIVAWALT